MSLGFDHGMRFSDVLVEKCGAEKLFGTQQGVGKHLKPSSAL